MKMVKLNAMTILLAMVVCQSYQHALPYQIDSNSGYEYDTQIDVKRASGMDERQLSARFAKSQPKPIPMPGAAPKPIAIPESLAQHKSSLLKRAIHGSAEKFRSLLDSIFRAVGIESAVELEQATETISQKLDAVAAAKGEVNKDVGLLMKRDEEPDCGVITEEDGNVDRTSSVDADDFEPGDAAGEGDVVQQPNEEVGREEDLFIDPLLPTKHQEAQERQVLLRKLLKSEGFRVVSAAIAAHRSAKSNTDADADSEAPTVEKRGALCH